MSINLHVKPGFSNSRVVNLYNRVAASVMSARNATKEASIQRYINLHDTHIYNPDAINEIYPMRQAIANFAKKENVSIDVYSVKNIDNPMQGADSMTPGQIAISVKDNKSLKVSSFLVDGDTSKIYPKVSYRKYLLDVRGEETQTVETARYSVQDTFLRHVFRSIETVTKSLKSGK